MQLLFYRANAISSVKERHRLVANAQQDSKSKLYWLRRYDSAEIMVFAFFLSILVFLVADSLATSLWSFAMRLAGGFISLILIPGAYLIQYLLPQDQRNLAASIVFGLVLQVVGLQAFYLVNVAFDIVLPINVWFVGFTSIAFTSLLFAYGKRCRSLKIKPSLHFGMPQEVTLIVLAGFILRLVVALLSGDVLSPDAALFADYARQFTNGEMTTSVLNDSSVYSISEDVDYLLTDSHTFLSYHGCWCPHLYQLQFSSSLWLVC
jgi:hypothetical protein